MGPGNERLSLPPLNLLVLPWVHAEVPAPWRARFTALGSALQGMDDTSSSEGSTVDCPDPEEILKKIPELAEDLEEPDDCFTEGRGQYKLGSAM